ncbi:serine/threonine-protein kinase [Anaeromyxobacter sp. Fw109-5]|uniref:serine/threonine-protein kinase n=1 Tax=Anaeromyxobacter sp. (strain Fw109-5) TaxID=404589 RepID=UPI0000ED79EB|nr:serine/threonine-protein kinase [Anaeromyxobacter sp. Fw109-5]ABS24544.1 protein kinase [Anaeromyxobacter sp. Fw109-5]
MSAAEHPPAGGRFEPESLLGLVLDGRYELAAHLATGGMGAVFRARHVHLRKDVAVKVLRPDLSSSPDLVERFRREAEIASALEHDNIVRVTDFGRSPDGWLFLVMELLCGESLFDRIRRDGCLSPEEAVPILWQVCAGLEAAHALGVVHRDLKPENVFLARTASGREVTKLLDFGIAKIADPASGASTQAGVVVGTPEYLAPEQALGGEVDARADLYAVGLIAWRVLGGRHPFKADEPRALLMMQATRPVPPLTDPRPDLGAYPALVAAVARACAKEPDERHPSASALRDDLGGSLGPAFVLPPNATPSPAISLSATPPARAPDPVGVADTRAALPPVRTAPIASSTLSLEAARLAGRARTLARSAARRARAAVRELGAHPRVVAAAAVAALLALTLALALGWSRGRTAAEARSLLAGGRPGAALALLDRALAERPDDGELLLLRARALHLTGADAAALSAFAAARARGSLDDPARADLVAALAADRATADRAHRLLLEEGEAAVPAVLRAAREGAPSQRLRALHLARDLGAEERLDRAAAYGALLDVPDCEVRREAAERLGEIGDRAALPALRRAALATVETKGFFGMTRRAQACGSAEAAAAARRIEAAARSP